jgi:hypothetical protein
MFGYPCWPAVLSCTVCNKIHSFVIHLPFSAFTEVTLLTEVNLPNTAGSISFVRSLK